MRTKITKELEQQVKDLRLQNFTYRQIAGKVGCSLGVIGSILDGTHIAYGTKEKKPPKKYVYVHNATPTVKRIISLRLGNFRGRQKDGSTGRKNSYLSTQAVLDKIGSNPICYLSGRSLDLNDRKSFALDHIIPATKGGDNSLDNLDIVHSDVNKAKNNLLNEEFIQLCLDVVTHNGYDCIKRIK
jgi:5-methylcytosine-specific restriction endonuclease McrA